MVSCQTAIQVNVEEHFRGRVLSIYVMCFFAGTPIGFMANVHCAAATENALALEVPNQIVDNEWWPKLVKTTDGRKLFENGFANVPLSAPGLGITLNEAALKEHLHPKQRSYFDPTPEWDEQRSHDRTWS